MTIKVLVTTGTTGFPSLVSAIEEYCSKYCVTFQVGPGPLAKTGRSFHFTENLAAYIEAADVVVTHAGAGTLFGLLEARKAFVTCPNLERVDKHQSDICNWIEKNRYGEVCWDIHEIDRSIVKALNERWNMYTAEPFEFDCQTKAWIKEALRTI